MPISPEFAIVIALATSSAALAGVAWSLARRLARQRAAMLAQAGKLDSLESDLAALLSCSRRIGERLTDGERMQRVLQQQLDKLHQNDDQQLAVQHAMKLLHSGLDLRQVTDICDLTTGEAEILQNLQRHQAA